MGAVAVAVVWVLFVVAGWRGIDFGEHWDEERHLRIARHAVDTGVLLPHDYWYPSLTWVTTFFSAIPELIRAAIDGDRAPLQALMATPSFTLRVRFVFVVFTSVSLFAIFGLLVRWRRRPFEAALAAALLGTSWELGYHARWITPDAVMVLWASLLLAGLLLSERANAWRGWSWVAVVAAGLCTASKYTAGLMLVPCLLAVAWQTAPWPTRVARLASTSVVFALVYLFITPGTVIEAPTFFVDVRTQANVYGSKGHTGYNVGGVFDHTFKMLRYFTVTFSSPSVLASLLVAALVPVGAWQLWRESRRSAIFVLLFPVRNLLVVAPSFFVLAAVGAGVVAQRLPARAAVIWQGLLVAVVVGNGAFAISAAESIRARGTDRFVAELAAFVDAHPDEQFVASPRVMTALHDFDGRARSQLLPAPTPATRRVLVFGTESLARRRWPANDPFLTERWFGPLEVNYNIYPTWQGDDRIVLMSVEAARAVRMPLVARSKTTASPRPP